MVWKIAHLKSISVFTMKRRSTSLPAGDDERVIITSQALLIDLGHHQDHCRSFFHSMIKHAFSHASHVQNCHTRSVIIQLTDQRKMIVLFSPRSIRRGSMITTSNIITSRILSLSLSLSFLLLSFNAREKEREKEKRTLVCPFSLDTSFSFSINNTRTIPLIARCSSFSF